MQPRTPDGERAVRVLISTRPAVLQQLDEWAQANELSRSAAVAHFVLAGLESEQAESAA